MPLSLHLGFRDASNLGLHLVFEMPLSPAQAALFNTLPATASHRRLLQPAASSPPEAATAAEKNNGASRNRPAAGVYRVDHPQRKPRLPPLPPHTTGVAMATEPPPPRAAQPLPPVAAKQPLQLQPHSLQPPHLLQPSHPRQPHTLQPQQPQGLYYAVADRSAVDNPWDLSHLAPVSAADAGKRLL
jgi:hypothetical protein